MVSLSEGSSLNSSYEEEPLEERDRSSLVEVLAPRLFTAARLIARFVPSPPSSSSETRSLFSFRSNRFSSLSTSTWLVVYLRYYYCLRSSLTALSVLLSLLPPCTLAISESLALSCCCFLSLDCASASSEIAVVFESEESPTNAS